MAAGGGEPGLVLGDGAAELRSEPGAEAFITFDQTESEFTSGVAGLVAGTVELVGAGEEDVVAGGGVEDFGLPATGDGTLTPSTGLL